jgi:hypothetical protein
MANKKEKSFASVGENVTYVPNGCDFGSRPKNTPVAAVIVNVVDDTRAKRKVANLVVFQDSDSAPVVRKVRVPHVADALEGESYFE